MSGYASIYPVAGMPATSDLMTPDTTQRFPLGMVCEAVDPYFGYGKFIYAKAVAAQVPGNLVTLDETFTATASAPTANSGFPIAVCRQNVPINGYCWYMTEGMGPVKTANSIATGAAIGLGTAGLAGTNSAGKQVLGMQCLQASAFTIIKANASTQNGSPTIQVPNAEGLFIGLALSGTGVGAGTIASIDPSGRAVTSTANSTATGVITLTGTYTGFLLARWNSPHVQGAIT